MALPKLSCQSGLAGAKFYNSNHVQPKGWSRLLNAFARVSALKTMIDGANRIESLSDNVDLLAHPGHDSPFVHSHN
jgi:hypothetical protein